MIDEPDQDGRYGLSYKEYTALRTIFGAVNALILGTKDIEKRCKLTKNTWCDLRCAEAKIDSALAGVLNTVPFEKLHTIRKELEHMYCEVKLQIGADHAVSDAMAVMSESDMQRLVKAACEVRCFGCDRCGKKVHRCDLYKTIARCLNYDLMIGKDGRCPFAEGVIDNDSDLLGVSETGSTDDQPRPEHRGDAAPRDVGPAWGNR